MTSGKSKGSCSGGEINRFGEETLNRRGLAELSTLSMWQETAAMRDVSPAYVGSGSFSSDRPAPDALGMSASLRSRPNLRTAANRRGGRVEDGRGSWGHAATLRFPSPLIEPDVRISRIRLSDWLRHEAHETNH